MVKPKKKPQSEAATQHDLELWGGQLQDQMQEIRRDMQAMEHRLLEIIPQKVEQGLIKALDERIEAYTEHKTEELLGVTGDEVKPIKDKQTDHESRLLEVEKKVGIR